MPDGINVMEFVKVEIACSLILPVETCGRFLGTPSKCLDQYPRPPAPERKRAQSHEL